MKSILRILTITILFSCSVVLGMAADDNSEEDTFEYFSELPQEIQKKIIWHAIEDVVPQHQMIETRAPFECFTCISPSGDTYACMSHNKKFDRVLRLCNAVTREIKWEVSSYEMGFSDVVACSDSRVATFSRDGNRIRIYDIHTGRKSGKGLLIYPVSEKHHHIQGRWDVKGEQLACWDPNTNEIIICDFDSQVTSKIVPDEKMWEFSWNPLGDEIAVGGTGEQSAQVHIYRIDNNKKVKTVEMPLPFHRFIWIPVRDLMLLDTDNNKQPEDKHYLLCDARTGELKLKISKNPMYGIFQFSVHPLGNKVFYSRYDAPIGEIDFDVQEHLKQICDHGSFTCQIKKAEPEKSRWQKMRDAAKRLVGVHEQEETYSKEINPLYVAAIITRLKAAKEKKEKVGLSPEEQMIFASLPKEIQKRLLHVIRVKNIFKIPWGESLYANDPVAGDARVEELDERAEDGSLREAMNGKEKASDSDYL